MFRSVLVLAFVGITSTGLCFGVEVRSVPETVAEREAAIREAAGRVAQALASPAEIDSRELESWTDLARAVARKHKVVVSLGDRQFLDACAFSFPMDHDAGQHVRLEDWLTAILSEAATSSSWAPYCCEHCGILWVGYKRRDEPPTILPKALPPFAIEGTRFEGTVRTAGGEPALDAVVEFRSDGARVFAPAEAQARFELPRSIGAPNFFEIIAHDAAVGDMTYSRVPESEHYDFYSSKAPREPKRLALDLTLEPPRRFHVEVVDRDGEPLAGAKVGWRAHRYGNHQNSHDAVTNATGRVDFCLPRTQPIACVVAFASGHGTNWIEFVGDERKHATAINVPDGIRLRLTGARTVTVQLCDETGEPWAGVPVVVSSLHKPREKPGELSESLSFSGSYAFFGCVTDHKGVATLDWLPEWQAWPWDFHVPPSREFVRVSRLVKRANAEKGPVVITLPRRVPITGRVVDADGSPVSGASVTASSASHEAESLSDHRDYATSDDDGHYRLNVPPNRLYLLYARHSDRHLAGTKDGFVVESRKPLIGLEVSVFPMARVFGRVTFAPDGKSGGKISVSRALVGRELSAIEGNAIPNPGNKRKPVQPRYTFRDETDDEGRFEFLAGRGTYTLRPNGESPQPKQVSFTVTDTSPREFNFQVKRPENPKSRQLVGKVVRGDPPIPLEAAEVHVVERPSQGVGLSWGHATTRADGSFEVQRPKNMAWLFARTKDGKDAGTAEIEPNQAEVTLALKPTATIKVRLVDREGKPLPARTKFEWGLRIDIGKLLGVPMSKLLYNQVVETDDAGHLTLSDMLVGVPYDVNLATGDGRWRRAFQVNAEKGGAQTWPSDIVVKTD